MLGTICIDQTDDILSVYSYETSDSIELDTSVELLRVNIGFTRSQDSIIMSDSRLCDNKDCIWLPTSSPVSGELNFLSQILL
jgi:hypothetical protein